MQGRCDRDRDRYNESGNKPSVSGGLVPSFWCFCKLNLGIMQVGIGVGFALFFFFPLTEALFVLSVVHCILDMQLGIKEIPISIARHCTCMIFKRFEIAW